MPPARTLVALFSLLTLTLSTSAQTADPIARVFHPTPPLPSYDVATIKPFDPVTAPSGMIIMNGSTVRQYIRNAYGPGTLLTAAQVIGGPDWIDKERYTINGKPPADLEVAIKKMKPGDQSAQNRMMQQSLLADRFHLKVHFEVREMPVYILTPAKGGLKIKPVDAPPVRDANSPLPPPPPPPAPGQKSPIPAGFMATMMKPDGTRTMTAHAVQMNNLLNLLRGAEAGDRPIVDQTGFTGYFDVDDLTWAPLNASSAPSDAPSLETALEETLGLRLVLTKGPVEVVVIDSIDRPSDN